MNTIGFNKDYTGSKKFKKVLCVKVFKNFIYIIFNYGNINCSEGS